MGSALPLPDKTPEQLDAGPVAVDIESCSLDPVDALPVSIACEAGAHMKLTCLERQHASLHAAHEELKRSIRHRVHRSLVMQEKQTMLVNSFAEISMATIAGWITAEIFHTGIIELVAGVTRSAALDVILSRAIYLAIVTAVVPLVGWWLRDFRSDGTTWQNDLVQFIVVCLPMFFGWACKDLVSAVLRLVGEDFWPKFLVTVIFTVLVAAAKVSSCYSRAAKAIESGGSSDTLWARVMVMPGQMGLAVGFAWNHIASWAPRQLQGSVEVPVFVFMIQAVYYVVVTTLITQSMQTHMTRQAEAEQEEQLAQIVQAEATTRSIQLPHVSRFTRELVDKSQHIAVDALQFVYAWAQLDTVDALFFTYLYGCSGPSTCSYQANFGFALTTTIVFIRLATMLKVQRRQQAYNIASTGLTIRALALNAGWVWQDYCAVAIAHAQAASRLRPIWTYLICTSFAWICMILIHRRFEVERRAWHRHCKEEITACSVAVP